MNPQVLAVKARLVQDHPAVNIIAETYCGGFVNRLTAAAIYAATGGDLGRCRRVANKARAKLRNFRRDSVPRAQLYEAKLAQLCVELALRRRTAAVRKRRAHQR